MSISQENMAYDKALFELGMALEQIDWQPKIPIGRTLDGNAPESRWRIKAILFLEANKRALQIVICKDGLPRKPVELGSDAITHVAAHLAGLDWLQAALVAPLASALCHLGLHKFCANDKYDGS